ncbi:hypothetical protein PAPYR_9880 [Paratrimastix pyriformis]|uniref:Uncharacterized protein n=1 Tax=Paratrimastix pyriformis TaxID=342808 RepID=A0ABQ8UD01_9EUKA|nr:hypothetical protein PAPYR_9880 [Paratrimastix pyriformis]
MREAACEARIHVPRPFVEPTKVMFLPRVPRVIFAIGDALFAPRSTVARLVRLLRYHPQHTHRCTPLDRAPATVP